MYQIDLFHAMVKNIHILKIVIKILYDNGKKEVS